jgi:hypothetical protein
MAPRAGFELHRKLLSERMGQGFNELNTPSDTPRPHALDSPDLARSRVTRWEIAAVRRRRALAMHKERSGVSSTRQTFRFPRAYCGPRRQSRSGV